MAAYGDEHFTGDHYREAPWTSSGSELPITMHPTEDAPPIYIPVEGDDKPNWWHQMWSDFQFKVAQIGWLFHGH